jgi:hypothetical protein
VVATLPEGAERQLVTFYQDSNTVFSRTLATQRDHYAFDIVNGTNANLSDTALLLLGKGELTQSQVNTAIDEHTDRFATSVLRTLRVGKDMESLGVSAILGTTGLHFIQFDLESKVESIGRRGLCNNVGLIELVLPLGLLHIPREMCAGCKVLPSILVPDSILSIGHRAFHGCSTFTTFAIPAKVTTIVDDAFEECRALETVNLAPVGSVLHTVGDTVFKDCASLKTIQFPESLVQLKSGTFMNCTSLQKMVLPEVFHSLGNATFQGCTSLVQVLFPENITSIGTGTFLDTTSVITL